jgi:heat shock protein HtpX
MLKRIFLFGVVNILVILTVTIILNIFGVGHYVTNTGLNYSGLFFFCFVWGMAGSLISLMLSKWMAKFMMGVQLVTENGPHQKLVETVHRLSRRAGLTEMPEVGIYQSNDLNAFATGPSRNNSLVAISTGLLGHMNEDEIEGVLAHEVGHIANGDMVTLALIQGVLNAFVMFFARVVAYLIDQYMRENDRDGKGLGPMVQYFLIIVLQIVFGIFASIIVSWFSRLREYRADEMSAKLSSKDKMISALNALARFYPKLSENEEQNPNQSFKAMQISSKGSFLELFSTHPKLEDRIKALQKLQLK